MLVKVGFGHLEWTVEMNVAGRFRDEMVGRYGQDRSSEVEHADPVEISEYGARSSTKARNALFLLTGLCSKWAASC